MLPKRTGTVPKRTVTRQRGERKISIKWDAAIEEYKKGKPKSLHTTIVLACHAFRHDRNDPTFSLIIDLLTKKDALTVLNENIANWDDNGDTTLMTPLQYAIRCGNPTLVEILLNANANPNISFDGAFPLYLACMHQIYFSRWKPEVAANCSFKICEILLKNPLTNVNLVKDNYSPLDVAYQQGNFKVCNLLLTHPNIDVFNVELANIIKTIDEKTINGCNNCEPCKNSEKNKCEELKQHKQFFSALLFKMRSNVFPLKSDVVRAIACLIDGKQSIYANLIVTAIVNAIEKTPDNLDRSVEPYLFLRKMFLLLHAYSIDDPYNQKLFSLLMQATGLNIDDEIADDENIPYSLLYWVCMDPKKNQDPTTIGWVKFLLEQGANPNILVGNHSFIQEIVINGSIQIAELLVQSPTLIVSDATKKSVLTNAYVNNDIKMVALLESHWGKAEKINYPLFPDEDALSFQLATIITQDNLKKLNIKFTDDEIRKNINMIMRQALLHRAKKILHYIIFENDYDVFKNSVSKETCVFTQLVCTRNFDLVNDIYDLYSRNSPEDCLAGLNQCLLELQHFTRDEFCEEIIERITKLKEKLIEQTTKEIESPKVSDHQDTFESSFSSSVDNKGISGRKYCLLFSSTTTTTTTTTTTAAATTTATDKDKDKDRNGKDKDTEVDEPTFFNGINLDLDRLTPFENSNNKVSAYFAIDSEVAGEHINILTKQSRFRLHDSCGFRRLDKPKTVIYSVNGENYSAKLTHEISAGSGTTHRILVLEVQSDDKRTLIYTAVQYSTGQHTPAEKKRETAKSLREYNLDFILDFKKEEQLQRRRLG